MQRVLIVDDELLIADTLSRIFESRGFAVRTAYSATEAARIAADFLPELVVCDITMPGRSGLDLMRDIAREHPGCKLIVLTGGYSNLPAVYDQCQKMPHHTGVLIKPCHPLELLREVGVVLASA